MTDKVVGNFPELRDAVEERRVFVQGEEVDLSQRGPYTFTILPSNDFHAGWLARLLGEPKPGLERSAAWREGWDTAHETNSLGVASWVMEKGRNLNQFNVTIQQGRTQEEEDHAIDHGEQYKDA